MGVTKRLDACRSCAPLLAVGLLIAMAAMNLARPGPADAEPYHQRVRTAAEAIPYRIGAWVGTRIDPPREAIELLKPNAMVSRRYTHQQTGETVDFLLVHCKDARDMAGHYPPICYAAHGWVMDDAKPTRRRVNDLRIAGTQYRFNNDRPMHGTMRVVIDNFIMMPDGRFLRDMQGVRAAAADYTLHFYGAAQIQLITSDQMTEQRRREIFDRFVTASLDAIRVIRSGPDESS